jgi:hypothetical protein
MTNIMCCEDAKGDIQCYLCEIDICMQHGEEYMIGNEIGYICNYCATVECSVCGDGGYYDTMDQCCECGENFMCPSTIDDAGCGHQCDCDEHTDLLICINCAKSWDHKMHCNGSYDPCCALCNNI